ncbi:MAG: hypothetical protein M3072_12470 [Candidatus Dormibacteraeota bacterium]|nr:hypothetical protein [Candidatus Dormibacteraeota bacterium]
MSEEIVEALALQRQVEADVSDLIRENREFRERWNDAVALRERLAELTARDAA